MDYIGDPDMAAPTLNTIELDRDEAAPLFDRVLRNIDLMLANNRIHGDLSAFNILYWDGDITLIDFPQVVPPEGNPVAWRIFERDVTRICEYFATQGVRSDPKRLAVDLWTAHGHKSMVQVHPRNLDAENPDDRRLWQKQSSER
jgi:RIO kinase 1